MRKPIFDEEMSLLVKREYESGLTSCQLSKKYNCSEPVILNAVRRTGGQIRHGSSAFRKHKINEHAFTDIKDAKTWYWAGFLLADGYVCYRSDGSQPIVGLGLARKDYSHIELFRSFIQSTHPIKNYIVANKYQASRIEFRSKIMAESLLAFGVVPQKSQNAKVPNSCLFNRDFWRGVIDGDGCLHTYGKRPHLHLCGTMSVCESFVEFLTNENDLFSGHKVCRASGVNHFQVAFTGKKARMGMDLLYMDPCVSLQRKQEIYDRISK